MYCQKWAHAIPGVVHNAVWNIGFPNWNQCRSSGLRTHFQHNDHIAFWETFWEPLANGGQSKRKKGSEQHLCTEV